MINGLNNIYDRINTIRKSAKSLNNNIKPEFVKEFENNYKKMLSEQSSSETENTDNGIHPYLEKKENIKNDMVNTDNTQIENAIKVASEKYNISEDLIKAVIKVESNYDQFAVSKAGAMGLMQLIPSTALEMNILKPFDVYENIDGGTHYLKLMLDKYNGDLDKSLAAYNAGPHRVDAVDGVPDISVTKKYIKDIKNILFK